MEFEVEIEGQWGLATVGRLRGFMVVIQFQIDGIVLVQLSEDLGSDVSDTARCIILKTIKIFVNLKNYIYSKF